ncbi:MAG: MnhB domain-containing protein [Verrucomicrobiae bacterium]|nr:MnhB domain-containing protein [Verrucomicrobiae bacterium]
MNRLDSPILRAVARITFFLVNVFAIYLLLRGHHLPGGGFIAGLATSISMVMLLLALGVDALPGILRVEPVSLAVAGLALAAFTAVAPVLRGGEFLRHAHAGITLPLLGTIEVGTPLLFDTGVFLLVIGVTCKMIIVLARSTLGEPALGWRERRRFAAPVETPIEEDAPPGVDGIRTPDQRKDRHGP